jgi:hypothetical protein
VVHQAVGAVIAVASGLGFPLTQFAIARFGRPGAAVVGAVTAGILAMDIATIATRDSDTESRGQTALLYAETSVAALATAASLALVTEQGLAAASTRGWRVGRLELLRRIALGTLFGMRSARFRQYLGIEAASGR